MMGERQQPLEPGAGEGRIPTVREETSLDQMRNGATGVNDVAYIEGEMTREIPHREPVMVEVVPGPELVPAPDRHDVHAEDTAMHDAEVRSQNPPIIVER
jgi:hypothetical protein